MELSLSDLFVHPLVVFVGLALGAVGVWFAMPRARRAPRELGAIVAAAGVGVILLALFLESGIEKSPSLFFYIFSAIGLGSALRVITHPRPVYSALFFILTILSSAGLYILLSAEFLAFALVIIYAGAILITYLFVIMLATQAPSADAPQSQEESDAESRNPAGAVFTGFLLLAALTGLFNSGLTSLPVPETTAANSALTQLPLKVKRAFVQAGFPEDIQVGTDSEAGLAINPNGEPGFVLASLEYEAGMPFIKRFYASMAETQANPKRYISSLTMVRNGVPEPMFASNEALEPLDDEVYALFQFPDRPSLVMASGRPRDLPEGERWTPAHWLLMVRIPDSVDATNLENVGLALLGEHPLALELAGVILLMALVGAVVIARKQIEFGEADTDAAAVRGAG